MPTTRTLLKTGDGNATAALVAGTVTNVAVVTLPSDPGYEYDVSISIMFKAAGTTAAYTTVNFGNFSVSSFGSTTAGYVYALGAATTNSATGLIQSNASSVNIQTTVPDKIMKVQYGPGIAVTCSIVSSRDETYYLHYSYIGRKTITESF